MVIIFILTINPIIAISASAQEEVNIDIHMIYQSTQTRFDNPVMVAGIWHFINITTELSSQDLILRYYKGTSMPETGDRDASNYYEWKYDTNNQWIDVNEYDEGYPCINLGLCKKEGNTYSFCVGIKDTLPAVENYYENWTLEVYNDGDELGSETVIVEKPWSGLAKTHGDHIKFHVAPFTEMDDPGDDYIQIKNTNNVPLYISITYGIYDGVIEFPGFNTTLSPYSSFTSTPIVHSDSWQPQILTIEEEIGMVSGYLPGPYIIPFPGYQFKQSSGPGTPKLTIYVGHSDYTIKEVPNSYIIFQYDEELEMSEDEIKDISVYISGNDVLTLDIRSNQNISILKVLNNQGAESGTHFDITSTNTSEYKITTQVKAIKENTIGYLYYDLEIDGETNTYSTKITIGPPEESPGGSTASLDITVVAGVFVVILVVIVYIVYTSRKYKRRY